MVETTGHALFLGPPLRATKSLVRSQLIFTRVETRPSPPIISLHVRALPIPIQNHIKYNPIRTEVTAQTDRQICLARLRTQVKSQNVSKKCWVSHICNPNTSEAEKVRCLTPTGHLA